MHWLGDQDGFHKLDRERQIDLMALYLHTYSPSKQALPPTRGAARTAEIAKAQQRSVDMPADVRALLHRAVKALP